jgi:hypothetical protein
MERDREDLGIELAWVGAPLRKRLEETLTMPVPSEISRLLESFVEKNTAQRD